MFYIQDKADDIKAGVKSTALLFDKHMRPILSGFVCLTIIGWTFAGILNRQGFLYYVVSVFGSSILLLRQISTIDFDSVEDCSKKFAVC